MESIVYWCLATPATAHWVTLKCRHLLKCPHPSHHHRQFHLQLVSKGIIVWLSIGLSCGRLCFTSKAEQHSARRPNVWPLLMYSHTGTFGKRFCLPNVHIPVWNFGNCQFLSKLWHSSLFYTGMCTLFPLMEKRPFTLTSSLIICWYQISVQFYK
jgi:hypothetical protein